MEFEHLLETARVIRRFKDPINEAAALLKKADSIEKLAAIKKQTYGKD